MKYLQILILSLALALLTGCKKLVIEETAPPIEYVFPSQVQGWWDVTYINWQGDYLLAKYDSSKVDIRPDGFGFRHFWEDIDLPDSSLYYRAEFYWGMTADLTHFLWISQDFQVIKINPDQVVAQVDGEGGPSWLQLDKTNPCFSCENE